MKLEIQITDEQREEIVREELIDFLTCCLKTDYFIADGDYIDTPILIGALIQVLSAYSTPAQLSDLAELMKAAP